MRILAVDPGAQRCGLAVIGYNDLITGDLMGPQGANAIHLWSDIVTVPRDGQEYQKYKLKLIKHWSKLGQEILDTHKPCVLVNEIVPFAGGNPGAMAQMYLANIVVTVLQSLAFCAKITVHQISANTVKTKIGGKKDASKVKVRNGVYTILPETKQLKTHNWSKVFDESDAHAIGLAFLGYDIRKLNDNKKERATN